ncbi:S-type pyocin domain-containing protein [Pseudomonas sp. UW4]|uniref:S-type pyocin domain-containing protein n=1 Tax=Pseudomonas sp. UW4 TaxID=1207075 RepID=UPI00029CF6B0|nr:S-type pyocin domain-containing protein [Pseudomonas sp. UW4]AFY22381.1 S-type Pyocin [Pseudomonas sp. UW4]
MNDAEKYLGFHRKIGPGSFEIGPVYINEKEPLRQDIGGYFKGSWGPYEGPHRGTSAGSGKLRPITPFIWDDLMLEQRVNQEYIDSEYVEVFNRLTETTIREIEHEKQATKMGRALSLAEAARIDQETTIKAIHSKASEYRAQNEITHSLYGQNPFFLMKELSFKKLHESLDLNHPNFVGAYDSIDKAYRAALELKRLSLGMHVLANQLPELSMRKDQANAVVPASREGERHLAAERLSVVNLETNIRFQLLPVFLAEKVVAVAGSTEGRSLSQSLIHYKMATDQIFNSEWAAVRPYVKANPKINAPLSKPELEALNNLVDLQANTNIGTRWQDYHVTLLHSENLRYLWETTNAFSGLIARAQEAERLEEQLRIAAEQEVRYLQEQARIAVEAEATRIAAEQARIAAEAEARRIAAEQVRIAAETEARRAAAEQARIAAEAEARRVAAEQARRAAEAEAKRIADEQARAAAEALRSANAFHATGAASAAGPLFMTSAGTVAVVEAASVTLQAAIRTAISALGGLVASVGAGAVVGVSALFYSSSLSNGELPKRYAFSTPLSDLASEIGQNLNTVAAAGGTVDLPYRVSSKTTADGQSELFVVMTDGLTVPSRVGVVAATYNAEQNVYTATTADVPPRTLTWTPVVNPGSSSTTSPAEQPVPPLYTGATVIPVEGRIDTFPSVSEASFDDFITVFPVESGLPPVYTMFRDRREDPGVATGVGQPVSGIWLGAASQGEGAPVPSQIADQLRGREFKNFRAFRKAFWEAVADDPELAKQFNKQNLAAMANGKAPFAPKAEWAGETRKFEFHHKIYVSKNGSVYGVENMSLVTPKRHKAIHREKK